MSTLSSHVTDQLVVGSPSVVGSLAVFPLISNVDPAVAYVSFAEACQLGASVKELEGGASVNDLIVENPLGLAILLYEGEEVLGAQQNRTFDASVLVPPASRIKVPVSCVEAGRWDGSRHGEAFSPAPQTANPRLRRMKNDQARASLAAGMEARAVQGDVWFEVAATSNRLGASSGTGALHDVFERHREQLDAAVASVELRERQVGMLAAIGGRFVVLDHVSQPAAFAALHGPLVQGYALDSLDVAAGPAPDVDGARDFVRLLLSAPTTPGRAVGLGTGIRFRFGGLAGIGLICDDELVTVTAFTAEPAAARRVRRPSRRRH